MLEQVSKPCSARLLVGGADVIPEIHRYEGQPMIFGKNDLEPIWKLVLLERNVRDFRDAERQSFPGYFDEMSRLSVAGPR